MGAALHSRYDQAAGAPQVSPKQLATIQRILDRHHVWAVPTQAVPDQLTLLAEPVTHVVEALRPTRLAQPAKRRVKRKQKCVARGGLRNVDADADAPLVDDPLPG